MNTDTETTKDKLVTALNNHDVNQAVLSRLHGIVVNHLANQEARKRIKASGFQYKAVAISAGMGTGNFSHFMSGDDLRDPGLRRVVSALDGLCESACRR